jgi:hypothetical protein
MNIYINGKQAEIILDTEKNLGEVMTGIEQWISPTGNRIQGLSVNGKEISSDALKEVFILEINEIDTLDVTIRPWREFASEALTGLYETCAIFDNAAFDERKSISTQWLQGASARFLASEISDLYKLAERAMSGEGFGISELSLVVEEHLREITYPEEEISCSEAQVMTVTERLEELPLDLQTGKDGRAAETVKLFSLLGEKLFRILFIYKSEGLSFDTFLIDGKSADSFLVEFSSTLRDLSTAYEKGDTILVGDIAEYELGPGLLKFFTALKNSTKTYSRLATAS